jgi:nitroreductase
MDFQHAIEKRRSIRHYKPALPSHDLVQHVLEAARFAPSRANTYTGTV